MKTILPILMISTSFFVPKIKASPNEERLLDDLLENYNPLVRPVMKDSDAVEVLFGISLQQIFLLDEYNGW